MDLEKQTVITITYAPSDRLRGIVGACIRATDAEFPDDYKFMGMDSEWPDMEAYADANGWTLVYPRGGHAPRLHTLLQTCIGFVATDVTWIIEHDTEILPGRRDAVSAMLQQYPKVAGIDCMTVDRNGKHNYPCSRRRRPNPFMNDRSLERSRPWTSLNCGCWRTEALRQIDWVRVLPFPRVDQSISRVLLRKGWDLCIAKEQTCIHHMAGARGELRHAHAAS